MRRRALIAVLLGLFQGARAARAEEPALPHLDPFERAPLESGREAGRRDARQGAEPWAPVLRATLVAGKDSLANLGGVVLATGDEAGGFRLVEVREFDAVFQKDGVLVVLALEAGEGAK